MFHVGKVISFLALLCNNQPFKAAKNQDIFTIVYNINRTHPQDGVLWDTLAWEGFFVHHKKTFILERTNICCFLIIFDFRYSSCTNRQEGLVLTDIDKQT